MLSVTNDFKTTIRNNAVYSDGYVVIKDGASFTRTYDSDELNLIEIMNDVFKNDTYIGEIGQSALKLNLLGDNVDLLPLDKELTIEVYLGVKVGLAYEYVKYQDFLLLEAKYNETTNFTEILATDKLVLLNQDYADTNTYPMSLGDYVESVCVACGLELNDKTFLNNAFSITEQPFQDVYNAREIIAKAAQLAMSFVVINPTNNKVIFKNFYTKLTTNAFDEELDEDEFYKIKLRDKNLGSNGVNTLVLRISQVEGENNTVVNATNVGIDGNIEVVISDNDFINSEAKRLSIINSMFTRIDTLKYQPLELEYRGFPYLELGDIIKVIGKNGTYYFPILESMIKYNGGLFGTIKAEPLINTETKYRNVPSEKQRLRSAEIKVDKVLGEVQIIAENEVAIQVGTRNSIIPFDTSTWEQGTLDGTTGATTSSTSRLRTIDFYNVESSKEYIVSKSDGIDVAVFWYTSTNTLISTIIWVTNTRKVTSPSNATKVKLVIRKPDNSTFALSEITNYTLSYLRVGNLYNGSKFFVTPDRIVSQADGMEFRDSSGNLRVYFDTVNNRYVFVGEIIADSGSIANFSLIPNYATVVSGTSGKAITGGSGSTRVGISPALTTGGFNYSFWAGNDNPINAPFRVLTNGGLRSSDAIIAGWTMSGTSISRGNTILSASGTNGTLSLNGALLEGISSGLLRLTGSFRVTNGVEVTSGTSSFQAIGTTTITADGNVIPATTNTHSCGTSTARWAAIWQTSGSVTGSDRRLKDKIEEILQAKEFVLNLSPVQYVLKDGESGRKHYGFIAQEVKETMIKVGIDDFGGYIDPTVTEDDLDENGQMLALRYEEFIAPMVSTIQSQQKEIDDLKARLQRLEQLLIVV